MAVRIHGWQRASQLVFLLGVSASLALVTPVNGLQPRSHLLALVHPIFLHGHTPASELSADPDAVMMDISAGALVLAGSGGPGLGLTITGVVIATLVGWFGLASTAPWETDPLLLHQQAWPTVPVRPPQ